MKLVPYRTFRPIRRYNTPADELFNSDLFVSFGRPEWETTPAVNVIEADDRYKIQIAAPGMNRKDFSVEVDGGNLIISGKCEAKTEQKGRYSMREFHYSKFTKSFWLPEDIKPESIKAAYVDGILNVEIFKKDEVVKMPPKQIVIN